MPPQNNPESEFFSSWTLLLPALLLLLLGLLEPASIGEAAVW